MCRLSLYSVQKSYSRLSWSDGLNANHTQFSLHCYGSPNTNEVSMKKCIVESPPETKSNENGKWDLPTQKGRRLQAFVPVWFMPHLTCVVICRWNSRNWLCVAVFVRITVHSVSSVTNEYCKLCHTLRCTSCTVFNSSGDNGVYHPTNAFVPLSTAMKTCISRRPMVIVPIKQSKWHNVSLNTISDTCLPRYITGWACSKHKGHHTWHCNTIRSKQRGRNECYPGCLLEQFHRRFLCSWVVENVRLGPRYHSGHPGGDRHSREYSYHSGCCEVSSSERTSLHADCESCSCRCAGWSGLGHLHSHRVLPFMVFHCPRCYDHHIPDCGVTSARPAHGCRQVFRHQVSL